MKSVRAELKKYKAIYKAEGWKGLSKKMGKTAAIALFLFFLIKGLIWLAIFYGAFEFFTD